MHNWIWCDQVAVSHQFEPGVGKSRTTHDQSDDQSSSKTPRAAIAPTSLTSAYLYKMSADDTSSFTLHLSRKIKVLQPPVETADPKVDLAPYPSFKTAILAQCSTRRRLQPFLLTTHNHQLRREAFTQRVGLSPYVLVSLGRRV